MHEHVKSLPEILGEYARSDTARFHMPGHKGLGMGGFNAVAPWDVTELPETDDLAAPEGALLHTEQAYASAYHAQHSFLLINGSSTGVAAMLLSLGQHKRVLLARNCHKSAINGVVLAGHDVDFVYPSSEGMVTAAAIDAALTQSPADAVLIVSPDYFGKCADLASIAQAAHHHGALLFVDAAHGAHFPFATSLPDFPADDVDMWCISAHKTLNAFTQSAVLHLGTRCPITQSRVRSTLRLLQSSSPSYLLMASLDWALHSATGWEAHVSRIKSIRKRIGALNGVALLDDSIVGCGGVSAIDPTRLTLLVNGRGISGKCAHEALYNDGIIAEMADIHSVVLITTPNDPDEWYERLLHALMMLPYGTQMLPNIALPPSRTALMSVRDAALADAEYIPLERSYGRIAAAAAGAYPPGIAALIPGEQITQEVISYLQSQVQADLTLFGISDGCVCCVKP
ncbi:MAG: aminotransferase class V-fold PLP-dependent enzyme [Clostridia bacterium]